MGSRLKQVVTPKEEAVFWLDKNGFWHNEQGRFEHRKIINYFHRCIKKDKHGYHLAQEHSGYREKVYFPYEDTALFVFDVIKGDDVTLVLNTRKRMKLKPAKLFIRDDSLYMDAGDDRIKFSEQALIRVAPLMEHHNDELFLRVKGRRYRIREG
jgi:hypothetical protein